MSPDTSPDVSPLARFPAAWTVFPVLDKTPTVKFGRLQPGEKIPGPEGCSYGIATGARSGVFVVDFDDLDAYEAMITNTETPLPDTFTVATGRGCHVYYRWPGFYVGNTRSKLAPHVDVRGDGGYAVAAGSVHKSGAVYTVIDDREPADAPPWLLARLQTAAPRASTAAGDNAPIPVDLDTTRGQKSLTRARTWLAKEAPCVSGDGGHDRLILVALQLVRYYLLSVDDACDLLTEAGGYNDRCEPRWSEAEIIHKLEEARDRSERPEGGIDLEDWMLASDAGPSNDTAPAKDACSPDDEPGGKAFIIISNELHENVADACAALESERNLYQRGGRLVRVVYQAVKESDREAGSGAPTIQELRAQTLKPILTSVADWSRKSKKTDKATGEVTWKDLAAMPNEDIVAGVLHRGEWPKVRVLAAISETPVLRPDGSIVQVPGYDAKTGYIYKPSQTFPAVPDAPTREDARDALAQLRDVFAEFSYVDEAAGYVPLAAVLSIVARAAVGAVPLFVFDAAVRGSGKSLQTDVISLIATGRPVAKANWSSNEEEIKKTLQTFAAEGVALFSWDNVPAGEPFGNSHLDAALTNEGAMQFRMLGRTESKTAAWTAVQLASGNNFSFRGDTARRSIPCRLEPTVENPEAREGFRHPNLRAWVKEERARLVVAALTVLRAYFVAGCPEPVQTIGSFEKWAALIPSAIRWAGGADVTTCRATNEVEPEKDMLRELHDAWPPGEDFTAKALFAKSREGTGPGVDRFTEALRDIFDGAETPMAAAGKLRAHAGRIIGTRRLTGDRDRTNTLKWTVE